MADKPVEQWDGQPISVDRWGKDHWSTFAYAETRAVDHNGFLDMRHMRPFGGVMSTGGSIEAASQKYPTRLKDVQIAGHTDLDCLYDAVEAGLLDFCGRATKRDALGEALSLTYQVEFTDLGKYVAGKLRAHKQDGGNFAQFDPGTLIS